MDDMTGTPDEMAEADRLIKEFIDRISEHVDSVTVFANKKKEGGHKGTWHMINGYGNWYARYGQIVDWLDEQKAVHSKPGEYGPG